MDQRYFRLVAALLPVLLVITGVNLGVTSYGNYKMKESVKGLYSFAASNVNAVKSLGYSEGSHLGYFTADYIESVVGLKVTGTSTFAGTSSIAYTTYQPNITKLSLSTGTSTPCVQKNESGRSRIVYRATLAMDAAAATGSANDTYFLGVTSTNYGTPNLSSNVPGLVLGKAFTTSTIEQIVASSTLVSPVIWPNNTYVVCKQTSTTSTQTGTAIFEWIPFSVL